MAARALLALCAALLVIGYPNGVARLARLFVWLAGTGGLVMAVISRYRDSSLPQSV